MQKTFRVLIAVGLLISALPAFGWGQKGHDIIAAIAMRHLTPATSERINEILEGKSLVYWANWLDNASHTPQYDYTKTWHYRNIDADENFDSAKENPKGDVLKAIEAQRIILSDTLSRPKDLALALKILVHLVGDIHQPMHLGHLSDLGGNKWKIRYFNQEKNLHGIWDTQMVETAHKWSHTEWADEIDIQAPPQPSPPPTNPRPTPSPAGRAGEGLQQINQTIEDLALGGKVEEWGRESHALATRIYGTTPQNSNLSYDYVAAWTPTIEGQLLKGGVRLAWLLNSIFDPTTPEQ